MSAARDTKPARSICFVGMDNYSVLNPAFGSKYFGGESVQHTLLAREFRAQGYDVSMAVLDHGQADGEVVDGIRVWKAFARHAGLPLLRFIYPRATSIMRALGNANAGIYYQSCAGMMTGVVAHYCRRKQRRMIYRVAHDTDCIPGEEIVPTWRDRKLYTYGLHRAHLIAAQSVPQREMLNANHRLASHVVNMVVEEPREKLDRPRDIDLLWVNNLRPFKRPERFLDVARALAEYRCVMIGGSVPGQEGYYEGIVSRARDIPNLDYLGSIPYDQVNAYFARSKVFVNTSESEGFPNSFLQAWVRGVPVVSFFDPGDVIVKSGLGAVPIEVSEMVETLSSLLSKGEALLEMSRRAREYVMSHHSATSVFRRYEDLLYGHAPHNTSYSAP